MVESNQMLLLAAATIAITLILCVLVVDFRMRKVREQSLELDALKRAVQTVQSNLVEIARIADRTSAGLQELSGSGLHFQQIKREQVRLSETVKMMSSAMEKLGELVQLRDEIKKRQNDEIKEIAEASRSLHEWRSRVTAVFSDVGHLFESEPIREFIDRFEPKPASYKAERPGEPKDERGRARKEFVPAEDYDGGTGHVLTLVGEKTTHAKDDPRAGSTGK